MFNALFGKKNKKPSAAIRTKEQQTQLLLKEYARVFKVFREHPFITIQEVAGVPPEKYRVLFRIDGLVQTGKSIESKSDHVVEITLPHDYPDSPPLAVMPQPAYHPNISSASIDMGEVWAESRTLADGIVGIGKMIAFQRYNLDKPVNSEAAQWAMRNKSLLPLFAAKLDYNEPEPAPESDSADVNQATARIVDEGQTKVISESDETENITMSLPEIKKPQVKTSVLQAASQPQPKTVRIETPVFEKIAPEPKPIEPEPAVASSAQPIAKEASVKTATRTAAPIISGGKTASIKPPSASGSYCPSCGAQNAATANFCVRCGIKLTLKSSNRMAKLFSIIGIIAVPVIILETGFIIVVVHKKEPQVIAQPQSSVVSPSTSAPKALQQQQSAPAPEAVQQPEASPVNTEAKREAVPVEKAAPAPPPASKTAAVEVSPAEAADHSAAIKTQPHKKKVSAKEKKEFDEDAAVLTSKDASKQATADNLKLGKLYLGIGSADDAIQRFSEVLAVDPTNAEAREGLAKAKKLKVP